MSSATAEIYHDVSPTKFAGHFRCDCKYVGTETMISAHVARYGWCPECWGSGTDAYPCLGICRECGGSGELVMPDPAKFART